MTTEPTFEELKAERAREWQDAQRRAAIDLDALREKLARMPEVHAPDSPWDTRGEIVCACVGSVFRTEQRRWISVNGRKYRAELTCVACQAVRTWDFLESKWVG